MSEPRSDCYVLAPDRTARRASAFLSKFAPEAIPTWDPMDPSESIGAPANASVEQLAEYLEENSRLSYAMYLRNQSDKSPYFAILVYCEDGSLILGLSGDQDEASAIDLLKELEGHAGSEGYWSVEEPPVASRIDFTARRATIT